MAPSTLFRTILVLALGFGTHVAADCTRSIRAVQGDTCASLAAAGGITVAQFLRSNPAVTSCAALSPGSTYCLEGVATAAPSTSAPAPTSGGPLAVSSDGTCGPGVTCKGSRFGDCCSEHGFCGSSGNYCGEGCQAGLGVCGSNPEPTPSPTITTPPAQGTTTVTATVTVTARPVQGTATTTLTVTATTTRTDIVTITRASIVLQTQTSYIILTSTAVATRTVVQSATAVATVTATAVATVTQIVRTTVIATATATATATQTVRATVLTTSTVLLTSTSTAFRTVQTTITKTNLVESTSLVIETLTTIRTISVTAGNTIGCTVGSGPTLIITNLPGVTTRPTTTQRPGVITTITQIQPGRPTPYLPGSSNACKSYDMIQAGDSCREVATRNDVSLLDFYRLNPSIDCDNLWTGYFVCVGT